MNENFDESKDVLEIALSQMRERSIPDGPGEELLGSTLAAMQASGRKGRGVFSRFVVSKPLARIAAGILIVVTAGLGLTALLRGSSVTFGDVVEKVRDAHAMSFVMHIISGGSPPMRMTMTLNDQGQACFESPDGSRSVSDVKSGRVIVLQKPQKWAIIMNLKNVPQSRVNPAGMMEGFKDLTEGMARDLGPTQIDGRRAEKFSATRNNQQFTVWADPQTREPIRLDMSVQSLGQTVNVSCTDFVMNPPIPEETFSLEIPKGYSVHQIAVTLPNPNDSEKYVVALLRGYAQRSGGQFPAKIDDIGLYVKLLAAPKTRNTSEPDINWAGNFRLVQNFVATLPENGWKYSGEGKRVGDASTVVFWYTPQVGGYRAIYGDLSIRELEKAP